MSPGLDFGRARVPGALYIIVGHAIIFDAVASRHSLITRLTELE